MDGIITKKCTKCGEVKDVAEFKKGKYPSWCMECDNDNAKKWRSNHTEQIKTARRIAWLKHKYSVTPGFYDKLYIEQGGFCAICGGDNKGKTMHIDHDHITGKIRGLLCNRCNMGLGNFGDNIKSLTGAIEYLKRK